MKPVKQRRSNIYERLPAYPSRSIRSSIPDGSMIHTIVWQFAHIYLSSTLLVYIKSNKIIIKENIKPRSDRIKGTAGQDTQSTKYMT